MQKLKVFVIEDDFIHASRLEMHLDEMGYTHVGNATNGSEALGMIAATQPDLLLVDIYLEGDRDGVEIVEYLHQKNPIPVIFITSYTDKETFERAKLTNPYAYIIKPFDKHALQTAIELAVYKFTQTPDFINIKKPPYSYEGWNQDQLANNTIFLKNEGKLVKVDIDDILYIEVKDKQCLINLHDEVHEVRIPLQKLEEKLTGSHFLRIHRSFIINQEKIFQIDPARNEIVIHHHTIPIGRAYREAFLNSLNTVN